MPNRESAFSAARRRAGTRVAGCPGRRMRTQMSSPDESPVGRCGVLREQRGAKVARFVQSSRRGPGTATAHAWYSGPMDAAVWLDILAHVLAKQHSAPSSCRSTSRPGRLRRPRQSRPSHRDFLWPFFSSPLRLPRRSGEWATPHKRSEVCPRLPNATLELNVCICTYVCV